MIVNPVAMTWDARGRLWVVERHESPLSAKKSRKDRIKILEDSDADGTVDKVSVFASGLSGATGILLGRGGVYVAEMSGVLFVEDRNGDDKPEKRTVISTGLGGGDRPVLLNGLTWGPDGKLYMGYNLFSRQRKTAPSFVAGGVARLDPRTGHFERYAEGLGNSWGIDFDSYGNAFVATGGKPLHVTPGAIYGRLGSPPLPQEPMGVTGNPAEQTASIHIYHGDQWPREWQGIVLHGKQGTIQTGRFAANGSTFHFTNSTSEFLVARDSPFTPASIQSGPDGAVWIADCPNWSHNRRSQTKGAIWRVVWAGDNPKRGVPSRPSRDMDLTKFSSEELAALLAHPNVWHRRMAQRLLSERGPTAFGRPHLHQGTPMHKLFEKDTNTHVRLAALWTMHGAGFLEEVALDTVAKDKDANLRRWAARLTGERGYLLKDSFDRLTKLAKDSNLSVRTAAAIAARQFVSGDLTTNTPPKIPITEVVNGGILSALFLNSSNNVDETFEFHFWMALEPIMTFDPSATDYFHGNGAKKQWPFSANVLRRLVRLVSEKEEQAALSRAILDLGQISTEGGLAVLAGLQGLLDVPRSKPVIPNAEAMAVISKLTQSEDKAIASAARQVQRQFNHRLLTPP